MPPFWARTTQQESPLGSDAETSRAPGPMPGGRDFSTGSGAKVDFLEEIVDSAPRIRRYFRPMALSAPTTPKAPPTPGLRQEGSRRVEKGNSLQLAIGLI